MYTPTLTFVIQQPRKATGPANSAAAPSASDILLEINTMRQRLDAIATTLSTMIATNEPIVLLERLTAPSTDDKALSNLSIPGWKGMSAGRNALPKDVDALPTDHDAPAKEFDALTNMFNALTRTGNAQTKAFHAPATADNLSRTKFKVLPG